MGDIIGTGTYGQVRLGRLIRDRTQKFAVKQLPRSQCKIDVLDNELTILRQLDHPNLVRLHEIYRDDKFFYFITEFLSGGELFSYV